MARNARDGADNGQSSRELRTGDRAENGQSSQELESELSVVRMNGARAVLSGAYLLPTGRTRTFGTRSGRPVPDPHELRELRAGRPGLRASEQPTREEAVLQTELHHSI